MAGAQLTIDYDFKTCPDNKLQTVKAQFMTGGYLNLLILILSLLKLVLTFKRMYFSLYTLNKIKDRLASGQHEDEEMDHIGPNASKWNKLLFKDKTKIFSFWFIIFSVGNFIHIISAVYNIFSPYLDNTNQILMALSVVFSWVSLCYYFDTSESYSNFYLTLKRSFITFASNVTFFFSFFIGFSVLAYCMFYHHYPFMTINYSFISLFALLWGDNFYTTVNKAFYISPLSVIFFFVTYFIIFTTFFNKVLISIVESAFESTKMRKRLYWMEKEMTFEDYIKYEYKQVLKDSDEEDEMKMNFLVETIENVVLATDKDPELYMRMQTEFLQKSGKLNKEAKKQIKKNFKRLQTLKESKEFYETLSKSYFSDPMYQPKSITVKKEGLINYKSITKQIEGICQTILQYLELFKDRLYLMEMHLTSEAEENHEEYENILQRSESECKKYYQLIDELKGVIKHHTKEIN